MNSTVTKQYTWLIHELWEKDIADRGRLGRAVVTIGRIVDTIVREFNRGQITLQVTGLAYTTLLSIVPLLAVSFSVLKAFGVYNELEPLMQEFLQPLGQQGQEVQRRILEFVNNLRVGVLGSVGLAMLFYTVISLVYKIEQAFNMVWRVADGRTLARRFSDYLSVLLIGPVLMFAALGVAQTAMDNTLTQRLLAVEPLGTLLLVLESLIPYVLISCTFAFLYGFLPNTHVRLGPAFIGGFVAGLLWFTIGGYFASFVATSSRYSAIYSGFAGAVLFVIWLYTNWLIVIVGCQVTAYLQNSRLMDPRLGDVTLNNRQREKLALEIMTLISTAHFYPPQPLWTLDALQARYRPLPAEVVAKVVAKLETAGLIVAKKDPPPGFLPARAVETISLQRVLAAVRGEMEPALAIDLAPVSRIVGEIDTAMARTLAERTLKELIEKSDFNSN